MLVFYDSLVEETNCRMTVVFESCFLSALTWICWKFGYEFSVISFVKLNYKHLPKRTQSFQVLWLHGSSLWCKVKQKYHVLRD